MHSTSSRTITLSDEDWRKVDEVATNIQGVGAALFLAAYDARPSVGPPSVTMGRQTFTFISGDWYDPYGILVSENLHQALSIIYSGNHPDWEANQ